MLELLDAEVGTRGVHSVRVVQRRHPVGGDVSRAIVHGHHLPPRGRCDRQQ